MHRCVSVCVSVCTRGRPESVVALHKTGAINQQPSAKITQIGVFLNPLPHLSHFEMGAWGCEAFRGMAISLSCCLTCTHSPCLTRTVLSVYTQKSLLSCALPARAHTHKRTHTHTLACFHRVRASSMIYASPCAAVNLQGCKGTSENVY